MSPRFDKLLVLDMDETLIYATGEPLPDRPADFVGPYHVYKRPHVDHFLRTCLDWFEVGVWTSAGRDYAAWVLGKLLPDPSRLAFVWTNERCTQKFDHEHHKQYELKPLKKLKRKAFARGKYSLSKLIVVDDTPATFCANYGNGIRVAEYQGEAEDVELLLLLKYLESMGDAHDVRAIEKRGWRSRARQMLDYPMSGPSVESPTAWAEDKATVGTDLSGDPGAKTEGRAMDSSVARLSPIPFGIGTNAINPARRSLASLEQKTRGDGLPVVTNSKRRELHFTLNQYTLKGDTQMGIYDWLQKRKASQASYADATKVLTEAEQLFQDSSGQSEPRWSDLLVQLSPDSVRAIQKRGWWKRGCAEPTNAFLVRVLGRIARERSPEENQLAIDVLRSVLDLPDDNTTGAMQLRNGCIRELDELGALSDARSERAMPKATEPFHLEPISSKDVPPARGSAPQSQPNNESAALFNLVGANRDEAVVQKFEAHYKRWSRTFDPRSHSVVLCSYGLSLQQLNRFAEALLAHRWACKIYPYSGFTSRDVLPQVEAQASTAAKKQTPSPEQQITWAPAERWSDVLATCGHVLLSINRDMCARLWHPERRECLGSFQADPQLAGSTPYRAYLPFAWSPEQHLLALPSHDRAIALWDLTSGRTRKTLTTTRERITLLGFSSDGLQVIAGVCQEVNDQRLQFYDTRSGNWSRDIELGDAWPEALSPGRRFVTACRSSYPEMWVMRLPDGRPEWLLSNAGQTNCVKYSPCGGFLAVASGDGEVRIWNLGATPRTAAQPESSQKPTISFAPKSEPRSIDFDPTSRLLVVGTQDGSVVIWDRESGREVRQWKAYDDAVTSACFAPKGNSVTTARGDGSFTNWTSEGKEITSTCTNRPGDMLVAALPWTQNRLEVGTAET